MHYHDSQSRHITIWITVANVTEVIKHKNLALSTPIIVRTPCTNIVVIILTVSVSVSIAVTVTVVAAATTVVVAAAAALVVAGYFCFFVIYIVFFSS